MAQTALRMVVIARNIDIWEIRTWRWEEPGQRYPLGVLWLFLGRKGRKRWGFIPVIPCSTARPECPVRLFRLYLWKLNSSPTFAQTAKEDEWGQPASVWISTMNSTTSRYPSQHHPITESTLSSECGRCLHECGVDEKYSEKSTRGAVSTYLLECGETVDTVMSRGVGPR